MYIGLSILLLAVGAILHWGVSDVLKGVDLGMIGVILMVLGVVTLLISLVYDFGRRRNGVVADGVARDRVVERDRTVY